MLRYIHKHTHLENTVTPTLDRDLSTALAVSKSSSIRYVYYCYFHTIVYILQVLETARTDTILNTQLDIGPLKNDTDTQ